MMAKTSPWGDAVILIMNPDDVFHPITIHALETYPKMIDDMNTYLEQITTLIDNGEKVDTREVIRYQLHWIIDNYDTSLEVPLTLVFDTLCHGINDGEFPANIFDDLSELDRPTKSTELILDISRRLTLYAYGYETQDAMHKWVDMLFEEGPEEQVYCVKG